VQKEGRCNTGSPAGWAAWTTSRYNRVMGLWLIGSTGFDAEILLFCLAKSAFGQHAGHQLI
jgi:hypothetical protein